MKNDRRKSARRKTERPQPDRRAIYRLGILQKYGINWITLGYTPYLELVRRDGKNVRK